VKINDVPVDKAASYRVAMNNFLADGGDGFSVFGEGTDPLGGEVDIDVLANYFMKNSPVAPGPVDRITRTG
jgi:5'-nucleotidase